MQKIHPYFNKSKSISDGNVSKYNPVSRVSSNIINIVNNVNHNSDKNKIGLKVNINQYDIKYYMQKNRRNNKSEIDPTENDTSCLVSDQDVDNSKESSKMYTIHNNNGINVDIIKISNKNLKEKKQKTKEQLEMEKYIRRRILRRVKTLNNLNLKNGRNKNRPNLNTEESLKDYNENNIKLKKCYSKENLTSNNQQDIFEYIKSEDFKNSKKNTDNYSIKKTITTDRNNDMINKSLNSNLSNRKSRNNTSSDRFELNIKNNYTKNYKTFPADNSFMNNNSNKNNNNNTTTDSNLNLSDYKNNLNSKRYKNNSKKKGINLILENKLINSESYLNLFNFFENLKTHEDTNLSTDGKKNENSKDYTNIFNREKENHDNSQNKNEISGILSSCN